MRKQRFYQSNRGLTLIELMTVLIIIMLLAMVGFPTYQEYQNRANLAEAQTTMGTMEKNLRTYFLSHGSFYSAAPTPATVPGLASLGDAGSFTVSGGWAAIGPPVASGSAVNYSYQAFAGQTPNDSTTPVVNDYLNDPTTNMNLIRRTSSAYNYRFPHSAGIASTEEKLRFDWSDFGFCASAVESADETKIRCDTRCRDNKDYQGCMDSCTGGSDTLTCEEGCQQSGIDVETCNDKCNNPTDADGNCTSPADVDCYPGDQDNPNYSGGKTAAQNCEAACTAIGHSAEDCKRACGEPSDSKCNTDNVADIDCYHADSTGGKTAAENCKAGCIEQNGGDPAYGEKCEIACGEAGDGTCNSNNGADIDCYSDTSSDEYGQCLDKCGEDMSCRETCLQKETSSCVNSCIEKGGDGAECEKNCNYHDTKCRAVTLNNDDYLKCAATDDAKDPGANDAGGDAGGGAGGGGSGGDAGGGSDNGGDTGDGSGGDAGGGAGSGDGSTSSDDSGSVSSSNAECASFGISKPTDFGVQTNLAGYNWVVTTAVANFSPGSECTLLAQVIQVVGGQVAKTDFIKINVGE